MWGPENCGVWSTNLGRISPAIVSRGSHLGRRWFFYWDACIPLLKHQYTIMHHHAPLRHLRFCNVFSSRPGPVSSRRPSRAGFALPHSEDRLSCGAVVEELRLEGAGENRISNRVERLPAPKRWHGLVEGLLRSHLFNTMGTGLLIDSRLLQIRSEGLAKSEGS